VRVVVPPELREFTTRAGYESRCHKCRRTIGVGDLILFRPARLSDTGAHRPVVRWHYLCGIRAIEHYRDMHLMIGAA